jgi:hypothetical protein
MKHKSLKRISATKTNLKHKPLKELKIWDHIIKQSPKHETYPRPSHFET